MKIATYVDFEISSGGGFSQSLSAVLILSNICESESIELLILTNSEENQTWFSSLGIESKIYKKKFFDKLIMFSTRISLLNYILSRFKILTFFEKLLIQNNTDLVYFVSPTNICLSLQKLNYIFTIWDLCHLERLEFPEVREFGEFDRREVLYQRSLTKAIAIVCDSQISKMNITNYYNILDPQRIIVLPFSPSPFIRDKMHGKHNEQLYKLDIANKYGLKNKYFFYPAQFWPHKNHIRVLEALKLLISIGIEVDIVFCGSDKGNLNFLNKYIEINRLQNFVKILGFVDSEDLVFLYKQSLGLVMPSYFGPTNIPPIEAWSLGVPVICSNIFRDQASDAALLVDPNSSIDIFNAMCELIKGEINNTLILNGFERIREIDLERENAKSYISILLQNFKSVLTTYKF
jgi:glycosyltransferase involved in cell wall biosynthesis